MKILVMEKDMKIKRSVFPPSTSKVWETFFLKKALHGERNLFGQTYEGIFYIGTNDEIMQGEGGEGGRFCKCISSHLNTVNLKISPVMVGDTLENKSLPDYRITE